jgi:hypothetical protein
MADGLIEFDRESIITLYQLSPYNLERSRRNHMYGASYIPSDVADGSLENEGRVST